MLELPLDQLQGWMQDVIVHPGSPEEAVASERARDRVPPSRLAEVLLPSATLTPTERVGIYQRMYLLRMHEALQADYPALEHFLGHRRFRSLVRDYVHAHPSRSHTLNRLGVHLPEFVRTVPGRFPRRAFCHDLARLELAISEVFDAAETAPLTEEQIAAVPPEAWERARLQPVEAFRLLTFRYPVVAYLQTFKDDNHDHPPARLKACRAVVYRRNYALRRLELSPSAYGLLSDLASGLTLGEAVTRALGRGGRRAPREDDLFRWFQQWVAGGMFRAVEHG